MYSNQFQVKIDCPSDIEIFAPDTFAVRQVQEVSLSITPYFQFNSFLTKTMACPVDWYRISRQPGVFEIPPGIQDQNDICASLQSSNPNICNYNTQVVYTNQHNIYVLDTMTPTYYDFWIYARAAGDNKMWFPSTESDPSTWYRLETVCPTSVDIEATTSYSTIQQSYLGAVNAIFSFSSYVGLLPKCQQVITYSITQITPASPKLTYPSSSCSSFPCTEIQVDTSEVVDVTFKISFQTQIASPTSETQTLTMQIFETAQSPRVIASTLDDKTFFLDSSATYTFMPFMTTISGYSVSYQIQSAVSVEDLPVSNLGPIQGTSFSVTTTSLGTYHFQIFAKIDGLDPQISTVSSSAVIIIECGSEQIEQTLYAYENEVLPPGSQFSTSTFRSWFSSTKSVCPLTKFSWTATTASIVLADETSISDALINVYTSTAFRGQISIYAHTAKVKSTPTSLDFTVCGNEVVQCVKTDLVDILLQKWEVYTLDFSGWFTCGYITANCHEDCCAMTYSLLGAGCSGTYDSSKFQFDASAKTVNVLTDVGFHKTEICIQAKSFGQVKAEKKINFEVCGTEEISITKTSQIRKVYPKDGFFSTIMISNDGYSYTSNRPNCPVFFKIQENSRDYTGTNLVLTGTSLQNNIELKVLKTDPIESKILIVGHSLSLDSQKSFQIHITVCGQESLAVQGGALIYNYRIGTGTQVIYEAMFKGKVTNNNTDCPVDHYDLYDGNSPVVSFSELSQFLNIEPNTYESQSQVIKVKTDIQQIPQLFLSDGQDILLENLQIEAITIGKANVFIPLQINLLQPSTKFNFPPQFSEDPKFLTVGKVAGSSLEYYYEKLPKIVDFEGDDFTVIFKNKPSYMDYSTSDKLTYTARINFNEITQDVFDDVTIILTDVLGNSRTYIHQIKVTYETIDETMDIQRPLVLNSVCGAVKEIISYSFKCVDDNFLCGKALLEAMKLTFDISGELEDKQFDEQEEIDNFIYNGQEDISKIDFTFDYDIYFQIVFGLTINGRVPQTEDHQKAFKSLVCDIYTISLDGEEVKVCGQEVAPEESFVEQFVSFENLQTLTQRFQANNNNQTKQVINHVEQEEQYYTYDVAIQEITIPTYKSHLHQHDGDYELEIRFSEQMTVPDDQKGQEDLLLQIFTIYTVPAADTRLRYFGRLNDSSGQLHGEAVPENDENYDILQDVIFVYKIKEFSKKNVHLTLEFENRKKLSQSPYGYDNLAFKFTESTNFTSVKLSPQTLQDTSVVVYRLKPLIDKNLEASLTQIFENAKTAVTAVTAAALILGVFMSSLIKKLMAIFKAQQISVHLLLLSINNLPPNVIIFNGFLRLIDLRNKDKRFVEKYYGGMSKGEDFENGDRLGYSTSNFLVLSGSIFINMVRAFIAYGVFFMINHSFKLLYKIALVRMIAEKFYQIRPFIVSFIAKIFTEGYLEFIISLLIALKNFAPVTKQDVIAVCIQYVMLVLVALPFLIIWFFKVNFDQLGNEDFKKKYLFYKDLRTQTMMQVCQLPIFMIRRLLFAIALIFAQDFSFLQFIIILNTNLAYTCYILHVKPFNEKWQHEMEIINEVFVQVFTYINMFFKQSIEPSSEIGWAYIFLYVFSFSINFKQLLENILFKTLPDTAKKISKAMDDFVYKQRKEKYFNHKLIVAANFPANRVSQYMAQEARKIKAREEELKNKKQFEKEVKWMHLNELPYWEIVQDKQSRQTEVTIESLKQEQQLPIENMLPREFPHNHVRGDRLILPPYNELDFINAIDDFLNDGLLVPGIKLQGLILQRVNKILFLKKKAKLYRWIEKRRFKVCNVHQDGNSAARAIAARIIGSEHAHKDVRIKICNEIQDEKRSIQMGTPGTWFGELEFQTAAYAYNTPIIIFCPNHKTAFFDRLYEAKTRFGQKKTPIYLLHNGQGHYYPLIHKTQQQEKALMENNGSILERFICPDSSEAIHSVSQQVKQIVNISHPPVQDSIKISETIKKIQKIKKKDLLKGDHWKGMPTITEEDEIQPHIYKS